MDSLLVLEEVGSSMESPLVALAEQDWTGVCLRAVDFARVALKVAFVAEAFAVA